MRRLPEPRIPNVRVKPDEAGTSLGQLTWPPHGSVKARTMNARISLSSCVKCRFLAQATKMFFASGVS